MRLVIVLASLAFSVLPSAGLAQQPIAPPDAFQEVIYMEIKPSQIPKALNQLKEQLQRLRASRADLNLVLLKELDRPNQYVLLVGDRSGHSLSHLSPISSNQLDISGYQILPDFVLESIPLAGSSKLTIPLDGFVMVAHLDADPAQRDQTLPQLNEILRITPGLRCNQGVQVLTWKKRSNHWTLIESWLTRQHYYSALEDPRVEAIRATIASHAAAPSDLRLYRRVD